MTCATVPDFLRRLLIESKITPFLAVLMASVADSYWTLKAIDAPLSMA
ncbi:MAG: hypothetical protein ACJAVI_002018 [Candidatus Azotimanducaceae bacterium]|jgi:hypothetical protein